MKHTCYGCKALLVDGSAAGCCLGYKVVKRGIFGFPDDYTPLEECPKPMTYKQFIELPTKRGGAKK